QLAGLATSDDVVFVHDPDGEQSLLALFRDGDRLVGAFAIDQVQAVMKMRALVQRQVMFDEALELAAELQIA
ncbi:MAG: oxidoreductase C-terminal domain-containing protein, partial [Myxococcota bacterium]